MPSIIWLAVCRTIGNFLIFGIISSKIKQVFTLNKKKYMKKKLLMTFLLAFFTLTSLIAQDREITGKVTSAEDGSGLPGVSVSIKGTTKGTQTNAEGFYSVSVPNSTTLVFSFVGLNSQTISKFQISKKRFR